MSLISSEKKKWLTDRELCCLVWKYSSKTQEYVPVAMATDVIAYT